MKTLVIPISKAKRLVRELNADAVIVIAFRGCQYCTAIHGKDRAECQAFSKVCDQIHEAISDGTIPIPLPLRELGYDEGEIA